MSSLICVICLDDLQSKTAMSTTCGHIFCSECAMSQFTTRPSCPVCRSAQSFEQLVRLFPEYSTPDPPSIISPASVTSIPSSQSSRPRSHSYHSSLQLQARRLHIQQQLRHRLAQLRMRLLSSPPRLPQLFHSQDLQVLQPRSLQQQSLHLPVLSQPQNVQDLQLQPAIIHQPLLPQPQYLWNDQIQTLQLPAAAGSGPLLISQQWSSVVTVEVEVQLNGQSHTYSVVHESYGSNAYLMNPSDTLLNL